MDRQVGLKGFSDRLLLLELITRNGSNKCPIKTKHIGPWMETLISVEYGHTAYIRMPSEYFEALHKEDDK